MQRTYIISDTHIGDPDCNRESLERFIHTHIVDDDVLIVNGDMVDCPRFVAEDLSEWPLPINPNCTLAVAGNHDRIMVGAWPLGYSELNTFYLSFADHKTIGEHGNNADPFWRDSGKLTRMRRWIGSEIIRRARLAEMHVQWIDDVLMSALHRVTPRGAEVSDEKLQDYALDRAWDLVWRPMGREPGDGKASINVTVCLGHTHRPMMFAARSGDHVFRVVNTGAWVPSREALPGWDDDSTVAKGETPSFVWREPDGKLYRWTGTELVGGWS